MWSPALITKERAPIPITENMAPPKIEATADNDVSACFPFKKSPHRAVSAHYISDY